jgi:hypothetical protein
VLINSLTEPSGLQVQSLALDLGLDRSEVLGWVADFRAKSKQEQARLLAPLQQQIQQQQQERQEQQQQKQQQQRQEQQEAAADPFWAASSSSSSSSNASAAAASPGALPFSAPNPNTGYVPFGARRDAAAAGGRKGRRLPAEVLRTLEGVYGRSPWPSKEVVAGLFDLHRLPRWVGRARNYQCVCGATQCLYFFRIGECVMCSFSQNTGRMVQEGDACMASSLLISV